MSSNAATDQETTFAITDTKLYVSVAPLSAQDNANLLHHLNSGFKRTISWNKYQSIVSMKTQNQYLDYLIELSFQRLCYHMKIMHTEEVTKDTLLQL